MRRYEDGKFKIAGIVISAALADVFVLVYVSGYFRDLNCQNSVAYATLYEDYLYLGRLAGDSTTIMVCRVSDSGEKPYSNSLGTCVTYFRVKVEDAVKGNFKEEDTIRVEQYDAEMTPLVMNQRYVLFLSTTSEQDIYGTVGGCQGLYWISDNNLVYSLNNMGLEDPQKNTH